MNTLHKCWVIAKKDLRVYYLRGPVLIFGLLTPVFLFLAFVVGRNIPPESLAPGLIGMAIFFTASALTPAVVPFETGTRTLERLLAAPLTVSMLIGGDVLAAIVFGLVLSAVPILISLICLGATVHYALAFIAAVLLSAICFAILGALFSTPPTDKPSDIMTLATLVRLPLIFVSGVFVPVSHMPEYSQWLTALSPLTYTTELLRYSFGEATRFAPSVCVLMLVLFVIGLWLLATSLHRRNMSRRLYA